MGEKFANYLLNNDNWSVIAQDRIYKASDFKNILCNIKKELTVNNYCIDEGYIIAIGFNNLDYLVFILLASILGLNLILCDIKLLDTLIDKYQLPITGILTTKIINSRGNRLLTIALDKLNLQSRDLSITSRQAKLIFFTSGTTGLPKLVVYEEQTLLRNALKVGDYLGVQPLDACLCFFPIHYMYGFSMLMLMILKSGTVLFERSTITCQEILYYITAREIRFLPLIQTILKQINGLLEENKNLSMAFKKLNIINASDKIYIDEVEKILKICPVFWNNFGQTEAGPRIFSLKITAENLNYINRYHHQSIVALGKPIDPSIEILIKDEQGNLITDPGIVGELQYRSPFAMNGYLNYDGRLIVKDTIAADDLIFKNSEGLYFWIGRKTESIKLNGKFLNIGLMQKEFDCLDYIEKSYFTIDFQTQQLTGYFVLIDKAQDEEAYIRKIRNSFRRMFPSYPRMEKIFLVDTIPKTLSGKVMIHELRKTSMLETTSTSK